jgi:membrane-associated phospholipid phosphatase
MKLKPVEWLIIVYQMILIILCFSFKHNVIKIDYRYLIGFNGFIIFFILFVFSKIKNNFIRSLYPLAILPFFYKEIGYLNHIIYSQPLDQLFINLDKKIFFGNNISLLFCQKFSNRIFSEIMHFFYFSYYLVTLIPAIFLYRKSLSIFNRFMFITFFSFFLYYIIYIFYPVYGPEFYYKILVPKHLNGYLFSNILKIILGNGEIHGAAFPSSHVGISLIIFILMKNVHIIFRYITFLCFIGICFSTVYIRAHYGVDVLAGILSGVVFYKFTSYIYDKLISD